MLLSGMANHTKGSQEALIRSLAEILHLGLAVSDALKQVTKGRGRSAKFHYDGQDWMIETKDNPRPMIKITLIE